MTPEEKYVKEYCDKCVNDTICTERGYVTTCRGFCKEKRMTDEEKYKRHKMWLRNKELEEENETLKKSIRELVEKKTELEKETFKLQGENEQLKNELQDYRFNYDNIKELSKENAELKLQLEEITEDRDNWKQRAIDTYGDC